MSEYTHRAEELDGNSVGNVISFLWKFPDSNVCAQVIGEVRSLYISDEGITVNLTGNDANGETTEFVLRHDSEFGYKS